MTTYECTECDARVESDDFDDEVINFLCKSCEDIVTFEKVDDDS